MGQRIERFKQHMRDNKKVYFAFGSGIALAGITALVMREPRAVLNSVGADCPEMEPTDSLSFFNNSVVKKSTITNNVTTNIERDRRGHPGFITKCLETDQFFETQGAAARAFDIPEMTMSNHLRGKFEDANGYHFKRIGVFS